MTPLFKVVYNDLGEERLTLIHEFQVLRMHLVLVLRFLALKLDVQGSLVGLVNNVAVTASHLSDMEMHNTRN